MAVEFRPLPGSPPGFGAEVVGVPPDLTVGAGEFRAIEAAWYRHSILLLRRLDIAPEDHIAFTRRFGKLHVMTPPEHNLKGHPEIFVVGNALKVDGTPLGLRGAGMGFHTDGEDKPVPNAGSFLYALQVPPEEGDTIFADLYAAYEALPAETRARIAGRRARFSRAALHHVNYPNLPMPPELRGRPDVYHPLARRHPKGGRTALCVGRWACDVAGRVWLKPTGGRSSNSYRNLRASRAFCTAIAGAPATRSCGTTAVPSTARRRSTKRATLGSCTGRRLRARRR